MALPATILIVDDDLSSRELLAAALEDGGYRRPELWLADGWATVKSEGWEAPLYWFKGVENGTWQEFTLHGVRPLALDAPVTHISYYEADAYAAWAGLRLPTEAEWEVAAESYPQPASANHTPWPDMPLHPSPASQYEGLRELEGRGWQWTQSAYLPYPGYRRVPTALGEYNGKWMINQMVLRGGSCATPPGHYRTSYRNFFHPDKRWQFTAIRLAR